MSRARKRNGKTGRRRFSTSRLDELVEAAIVDCDNESEQATGLYTMIATVLGVRVIVERVDLTQRDESVAVCRRAGVRQAVPLLDLPLPSPPPEGTEWIEAYRHWLDAR